MTSPTNDRVANFKIKAHTIIRHAICKKLIKDKQIATMSQSTYGGGSSESLIIKGDTIFLTNNDLAKVRGRMSMWRRVL